MSKRKLRNAGCRHKASLGGDSAAILAAAGINVAGTMAASAISANAAKNAARDQATATTQAAQRQAQAIKEQSDKARDFQEQSQEFIKEQNAENRAIQKDIQMQLQMLNGQQTVNDRLEASKIKVKYGGKTLSSKINKSRVAAKHGYSLRGGNMPFQVTDGGGVVPVGQTPEGFELYELVGNDHDHYHKTRGKYKSGVGIKFADGNVVEGEGNQHTGQGEYMLETPTNAYFISKHNIAGFNPAKAVNSGMHPLMAFNIQEQQKAINGITDDGKANNSPRRKNEAGGLSAQDYYNMITPALDVDIAPAAATGVAYGLKNKYKLKYGGRVKAENGWKTFTNYNSYQHHPAFGYIQLSDLGTITPSSISAPTIHDSPIYNAATSTPGGATGATRGSGFSNWVNKNADLIGAGLGALGNVGGALITASANRSAAKTLSDAYSTSADMLANAYRSMKTIDMSNIRREDYAATHAMPVLQAPVSFAANQTAEVNRGLQRRLRNAGRYSMSSAAAQDRMTTAEIDSQDLRNKIYSADQQQMQAIRQANAERVAEAANLNAKLDSQANKDYTTAYLSLLQYNNEIENQKILGAAGALSEGAINGAQAMAQSKTSAANAWANALTGSTQGFTNALSNMATRKADLEKVKLSANTDTLSSYYANSNLTTTREAFDQYKKLRIQWEQAKQNGDTEYANVLKRQINSIASGRGFGLV